MVYQILISTMYLHFSNFFLVFMIVGLVGEAIIIAEDFRPLILLLFLSPNNSLKFFQTTVGKFMSAKPLSRYCTNHSLLLNHGLKAKLRRTEQPLSYR